MTKLRHQKGYKHKIKIRGILQVNVCINNLVFIVTLSEWTKSVRCMFSPFLPSYLRRFDSCVQVLTPLCMLLLRSQVLHWVVANIYCQYIYPHSCTLTSQFWYAAPSDVLHNQNKLHWLNEKDNSRPLVFLQAFYLIVPLVGCKSQDCLLNLCLS